MTKSSFTCAHPGDQEHDHGMCQDVLAERYPDGTYDCLRLVSGTFGKHTARFAPFGIMSADIVRAWVVVNGDPAARGLIFRRVGR